MALDIAKLRLMTFPQRIVARALEVNVLLLPTQGLLNIEAPFVSAVDPDTTVMLPKFIGAALELRLQAIAGLASYPFALASSLPPGVTPEPFATGAAFPPDLPELYEQLATEFDVAPAGSALTLKGAPPLRAADDGIRKYLPLSYRQAFNFTAPRTEFARTDDSYHCAIRNTPKANPAFAQSDNKVTWGRVLALALRQPQLAERIGLVHRLTVQLPRDAYFADGGWLWCELASPLAGFDIADPLNELLSYAARIPPVDRDRQLFAALQFPVVPGPALPGGDFDTLKIEAADYDDGFAKVVHAVQPVSANLLSETPDGIHVQKEIGIRLGWDDEQLLIWQNRQLLADPGTGKRVDAPLGVFSYRVDVRQAGEPSWHSLVAVQNRAALMLGAQLVAPAQTPVELGVQVFPATLNGDIDARYWLPSYLTQWYGPSLVLPDTRAAELDASQALQNPGTYSGQGVIPNPGQRGGKYEPLLSPDCELKYGRSYAFRVRLSDVTGGGPAEGDDALYEAPGPTAKVEFRRHIVPHALAVTPVAPQVDDDAGSALFLEGTEFTVARPRLGYPALLFTGLDTEAAMQQLRENSEALHLEPPGGQRINDYRAVGSFDPDVDSMLVVVEVRTLALDTLASVSQREPFIPLYVTLRRFAADPAAPFTLALEYRNADVIDFSDTGGLGALGDLDLSQVAIDTGNTLVLPRSRDLRITLYPVCSDKPTDVDYFGFAKTRFGDELHRIGEPTQFFVRENAEDEIDFFTAGPVSRQLQGIYLQPDPHQITNGDALVATVVEGSEMAQSTLIARLAAQLGVDFHGLTLFGKPGERIHFGCSNRIRHTLAPDGSSLSFATRDDLVNHWLCVLAFDIRRDWTWDGLAPDGVVIKRQRRFTGEPAAPATTVVGAVQLHRTASRTATTDPDRSRTRILFIDAVEPKKDRDAPDTATHPFPNTIDVEYTLTPQFTAAAPAGPREAATRGLLLPVTTIPAQVPKIIGAGYALSPYLRDHDYSQTAVRERRLWLEFDAPVEDPNDAIFARVLAYAPDPLLAFPNPDQVAVRQDDPPLSLPPELIRVITANATNDNPGLDAMQELEAETGDPSLPLQKVTPTHYLVLLPPGLHAESPENFGFFTYELRVGHTDRIWSTAQGRFGHPTRLSGVQHPAPPLSVLVDRSVRALSVTAPHATAVFGGRNVTARPPKTEIWAMLYAQVMQADAQQQRNVLLAEARLELAKRQQFDLEPFLAGRAELPIKAFNALPVNLDAPTTGVCAWSETEIRALLAAFNLAADTRLSVLAVEMIPRYDRFVVRGEAPDQSVRPLSEQLGQYRILRTSPLVAVPAIC